MNKEFYYQFPQEISPFQASELDKKMWYLSEQLESYLLEYNNEKCIGIRVTIEESEYPSFLKYLTHIMENDIYGLRNITPPPLWDKPSTKNFFEEETMYGLVEQGLVHVHGEGQVSLKYPLTALFDFFDTILRNIAVKEFNAEQYIFPTLLKSSILEDAGYLDSFPNLWMYVARLHNNYETYSSFKEEQHKLSHNCIKGKSIITEYSLPPTMCYYVYDMLRNTEIRDRTITACGKSFRHENKYCKSMARLWDFTIREIVFLGSKAYVDDSLEHYRQIAQALMDLLDLSGKCVYANDPFYLTDHASTRINVQKMYHSKIELRLDISNDDTLAIASFNRHHQYITKPFHLYAEGKQSFGFSGCIGFGLERLIFAFLCQHGIHDDKWPIMIKENYKKPDKDKFIREILKKVTDKCPTPVFP